MYGIIVARCEKIVSNERIHSVWCVVLYWANLLILLSLRVNMCY